MSKGVDLYIPEVQNAQVGASDFRDQVTGVVVRSTLNAASSLELSVQPPIPGSQVRVLGAGEALDFYTGLAQAAQRYAFTRQQLVPDTRVRFQAGRGPVDFAGYFSASAPTMGMVEAGYGITASGSEAALSLIDFTAYRVLDARADSFWDQATAGRVTTWKQLMLQTLQALTADERVRLNDDAFARRELDRSLERNRIALPALYRIIAQSDTPFLDAVFEASAGPTGTYPDPRTIAAWIGQTAISTGQGGAWGWLMGQAQAWGLQYVPMAGGVGRLVESSQLLDQEPISLEVEAQQLDASLVMSDILPTTRVVVMYPSVQKMPETSKGLGLQQNLVGAWPEDGLIGVGTVDQVPVPPWLEGLQNAPPLIASANGFNLRALASWDAELVRASGFGAARISQILSWWARTAYRWQALSGSQAQVTGIPLDGRFQVGDSLRVSVGGGVPITGIIDSVTHNLSVSDRGGQASTNLSLTRCRFGDFLPPGW
jgi:hypothetical protein